MYLLCCEYAKIRKTLGMSKDVEGEIFFSSAASQIRHSLGIAFDAEVREEEEKEEEESEENEQQDEDDSIETTKDGILPILSLLTSTLRNLRLPSSRSACLELIASLGQHVKDEIVLQRLVPYVVSVCLFVYTYTTRTSNKNQ